MQTRCVPQDQSPVEYVKARELLDSFLSGTRPSSTFKIITTTTTTTPWSRVLPEKLKHPELLKKFPAFYGTRRFITAFTRARHLPLS
jgi:hypothetical protein